MNAGGKFRCPTAGNKSTEEWSTSDKITVVAPANGHMLSMPVIDGKSYKNPSPTYGLVSPCTLLEWKCSPNAMSRPSPSSKEAAKLLPSSRVDHGAITRFTPFPKATAPEKQPDASTLQATWMSHSAFIVTAGGYTVLTDPVWSKRASPVQFAGPARMLPPPVSLDELPYVDVVSISHNHYDHLDTASVTHLITSNHKRAAERAGAISARHTHPVFVVPMGMKTRWFAPLAKSTPELDMEKVVELMWWDTADVTAAVADNRSAAAQDAESALPPFHITAVPVQHWSQRSIMDRNTELWCGFVFDIAGNIPFRFFHCGDTGYYKKIFKEIGNEFGPFDFAMIPIGAYEPRFMMANQHIDPFEAVEIHNDIKSLNSAGMHWGTFVLTYEPVDEPPKALAAAMSRDLGVGHLAGEPKQTDDANAELLRSLRKDDFMSATLNLKSDGGAIPYVDCPRPFRALRHGETWEINQRGWTPPHT